MADAPPFPGISRWVKVSGIIVIVAVLLVITIMFTGGGGQHGPGRHRPSGDSGGHAPPTEHGARQP
jgi:hypothetical protein